MNIDEVGAAAVAVEDDPQRQQRVRPASATSRSAMQQDAPAIRKPQVSGRPSRAVSALEKP
jgi:hypothetical protein